jgi:hypothetical protein
VRAPHCIRALFGALLVGSALLGLSGPAGAVDATVSTETELRAALADPTTGAITLASSIDLTDCSPAGGDLDRAGALVLDGAGFTIRQTCPGERVLESTAGALTLEHVTITGGDQTGVDFALGGGVLAANDLVLDDTTVTHNTLTATSLVGGTSGGGFGGGVEADGSITATGSHVDENSIVATGGAYGAGIASGAGEDLTITDSTVDRNTSQTTDPTRENSGANGGGIALVASHDQIGEILSFGGSAHLVRSSVSGNVEHTQAAGLTFAVGAGIFADGVTLESSHVDANELRPVSSGGQGAGWGGGLLTASALTAIESSIDRNVIAPEGPSQSGEGAGVFAPPSDGHVALTDSTVSGNTITVTHEIANCAGLISWSATLTRTEVRGNHVSGGTFAFGGGACAERVSIDGSTLRDNVVTDADEAWGGGAIVGTGTIRGSTISGNTVTGSAAHGGGLMQNSLGSPGSATSLEVVNSTITGNRATGETASGGGIDLAGPRGALPADPFSVTLGFSTVTANEAASGANISASDAPGPVTSFASTISDPLGGASNCDAFDIADQGYSQITDASCGTVASADPQLGALGDNGGPTFTMLESATSPLLDQVPSDACLALVTTDQRGVTRPQGSACDIGAVEIEVAAPPTPEPTPTPQPPPTATAGPTAAPAVVADPRFTG